MRVLVMWADNQSPNLGVRVLGAGTAALVHRALPDAQITPVSWGLDTAPMRVGDWRALTKERVTRSRGLLRWLAGFDLAIDTRAGDSFADIYGIQRLATMSILAEWVAEAGVPLVLGPQTVGPFTTRRGRSIARWSMRRAHTIMTRDSASSALVRRMGRTPVPTTDVVFALPVPEPGRTRDVVLNVSGLLWQENSHVDATAYRAAVRTIVRGLLDRGRTVALLAHVIDSDSADNDVPAVQAVAGEFDGELEVLVPGDLDEVRQIVASARLVLGSRMHACLNALSCGTPAVPLAYSRKFGPLLRDIGWNHTVDLRTDPNPAATALATVDGLELGNEVAALRDRTTAMLDPALQALTDAVR